MSRASEWVLARPDCLNAEDGVVAAVTEDGDAHIGAWDSEHQPAHIVLAPNVALAVARWIRATFGEALAIVEARQVSALCSAPTCQPQDHFVCDNHASITAALVRERAATWTAAAAVHQQFCVSIACRTRKVPCSEYETYKNRSEGR